MTGSRGARLALGLAWVVAVAAPVDAKELVVEAGLLYTVSGDAIENAVVVVRDDRIAAVGRASEVAVGEDVRRLRAAVVTPGFVDVHTSAGLSGLRNVPAVQDQDEAGGPGQADVRALDGFDPRDPLLRFLLEHGVTLVQTGPGPSNPIAGQAGIFRTHGRTADEMAVRFPSAMVFNLGDTPKQVHRDEGPSTRPGTAALIRRELAAAREHGRGLFGRSGEPDLGREALALVIRGKLPAVFTAHRADDIVTALRIREEFGLRAAIAGATEGYLVRERLAESGVPVFVGPVMERVAAPETENASYENAALLAESGVPLALRTGFESYVPKSRVLLFEAAIAAVNGLGRDGALRAITLDAAQLLELDDDYGSVEPGKVADLVLFDGDPFEYTSHVLAVVSAGSVITPTH